jgi:hypothetical protein
MLYRWLAFVQALILWTVAIPASFYLCDILKCLSLLLPMIYVVFDLCIVLCVHSVFIF